MRTVVQRVSRGRVDVNGETVGAIERGLLVLLGVQTPDTERDADYLAAKIVMLRIFNDAQGKMNRDVQDVQGGVLVVSQFTLYGDTRKGRRPSFVQAAHRNRPNTSTNTFSKPPPGTAYPSRTAFSARTCRCTWSTMGR